MSAPEAPLPVESAEPMHAPGAVEAMDSGLSVADLAQLHSLSGNSPSMLLVLLGSVAAMIAWRRWRRPAVAPVCPARTQIKVLQAQVTEHAKVIEVLQSKSGNE